MWWSSQVLTGPLARLDRAAVTRASHNALQSMEAQYLAVRTRMVVPAILLIWVMFLIAVSLCFANGIGW